MIGLLLGALASRPHRAAGAKLSLPGLGQLNQSYFRASRSLRARRPRSSKELVSPLLCALFERGHRSSRAHFVNLSFYSPNQQAPDSGF
jgi:hypothetical protein